MSRRTYPAKVSPCRVVMGMGAALEVTANVDGQAQSVIRMFSYRVPTITSLTPDRTPTAGGTNVDILGTSFEQEPVGPIASYGAYIGNSPCSQSIWKSESSLRCVVPPGGGRELKVTLNILRNVGSLSKRLLL
jgi:hypothetical protein